MRIAIVDDNAQIRLLLRALLDAEASCRVVAEADDGESAAQAVADSEAELVIVDYHMTRVDGVEATRRIRQARPSAEVIAFTADGDDAVAAAFLATGACRQFNKASIGDLVSYVRTRAAAAQR